MNKEALALRLLMAGFDGKTPTPFIKDLLRRGLGGVVLFRRNVESPRQVAELTNELCRLSPLPRLLIAVDQEGGRVARLREGFCQVPPMRRLGELGDAGLCRRVGRIIGEELRAVGISYDFAPVLDVDTNPQNPVIGDRSFSRDPQTVARLGLALAEGLQEAGVAPCGKHFPGHGDTLQDSHKTLPRLARDLDSLRAIELLPFREAAQAKLASIMTAHVVYPALDPDLPATLSPHIIPKILRQELGFEGVVVSDDLEMAAIAERFPMGEAARLALQAGVDILLVCHREDRQEEVLQALADCDRGLLEQAASRVAALADALGPSSPVDAATAAQRVGLAEHRALFEKIASGQVGADPTEA